MRKCYAVYKGEDLVVMGTKRQCARKLGVQEATIYYYTSAAYERKRLKRKSPDNAIVAFVVED